MAHIIDDGTLFRLGEHEYRLCTAEWQLDWLLGSAIGFDVQIEEVTADIAALAMQGPTSCAVLRSMGLGRYRAAQAFRDRFLRERGNRSDGFAHRIHRRPGLRTMGRSAASRTRCGMP